MSERRVVNQTPKLPVGALKSVDAQQIVALQRETQRELIDHASVINKSHIHVEEGVEEVLEYVTFRGEQVYVRRESFSAGPNGSPSAWAQVAITIPQIRVGDWWIKIDGHIDGTSWATPPAGSNILFGHDMLFVANSTTLAWRSDYNAASFAARVILEYQKP